MSKINLIEYITENTLRCEVSYRGGGIEIDASAYLKIDGAKMTAYQNYLGGGMLGSIGGSRNFTTNNKQKAVYLNSQSSTYTARSYNKTPKKYLKFTN